MSSARFLRSASGTTDSAASWVAASRTGGARPASSASFQRDAQRHQQSPCSFNDQLSVRLFRLDPLCLCGNGIDINGDLVDPCCDMR